MSKERKFASIEIFKETLHFLLIMMSKKQILEIVLADRTCEIALNRKSMKSLLLLTIEHNCLLLRYLFYLPKPNFLFQYVHNNILFFHLSIFLTVFCLCSSVSSSTFITIFLFLLFFVLAFFSQFVFMQYRYLYLSF